MINSNLLIYKQRILFKILAELDQDLNFQILEINNEKSLEQETKKLDNYIIITKKEIFGISHQLIFNQYPVEVSKLVEKINVEFMKKNFEKQSQIIINNYTIDLNARELRSNTTKLKLTEKEINTIIYMSKSKNCVSIEDLEKNVWKYQSDIETHTVETHIYRLRKKILKTFKDENFILSKKNGYQIS
jgi:hypothetical protein|tara:strand:+ start:719 stop:1282 length:564 start_codon:yes stop_codon:yes gene_type:complete